MFGEHEPLQGRNGAPSRRARGAIEYSPRAGSGVRKVGAPDCIDSDEAKLPSTAGVPGFTSCTNAIPAMASARVCAVTPATVTGAIAPARMNGVIRQAWLLRA